ncbi:MAG: hypothetical protein NVSMB7_00230 [Chitinophagaceae bacterium]
MDETLIVNKALDKLNQQTGMHGNWEPRNKDIDGEIDFYFATGNVHVFVEVKKELREHQLPKLLEMAERYPAFMVVAERIFPTLKELLREKKIGYLDTAGYIYVQTNGNFIWLDGNKPITEEKPVTNRAFTKTGLKTIFYLLLHQDAINMPPYRKLANATDVALGNIKNVIEGLKDAGFILHVNDKTLRLQNKRLLLDRWIAGYRETLKPALKLGKFRFWNTDQVTDWQTLPIEHGVTVWGGEPAAEHLINYLRPEILTAYKTELRGKMTADP